jgi:hypothetical protein
MEEIGRENVKVRPNITTIENNIDTSPVEQFQNDVLRPIIKMQHELLMVYFKNYIVQKKINFKGLSTFKQIEFIESFMKSDLGFRGELRGLVIGQFTVAEYEQYVVDKSELNKRMINIIQQRILSNLSSISPSPTL